jgi:hypothetical protein
MNNRFRDKNEKLTKIFFAISACSWMPHWSCHYYKIETNSPFIVGPIEYTNTASIISMVVYSVFIGMNLISIISDKYRIPSSLITGIFHLAIAGLHVIRIINPFPFVVFGYSWSLSASLRESIIVGIWGLLSIYVFQYFLKEKVKTTKFDETKQNQQLTADLDE